MENVIDLFLVIPLRRKKFFRGIFSRILIMHQQFSQRGMNIQRGIIFFSTENCKQGFEKSCKLPQKIPQFKRKNLKSGGGWDC